MKDFTFRSSLLIMSFGKPIPIQDPTPEKAYLYAIRLLAKRDYSEVKMRQKLRDKGFPAEHQDYALDEVLRKNYLREDAYINSKIKGWMLKGYSPTHISFRFIQEQLQVSEDTIREVFKEERVTTEDQIQWLIQKKRVDKSIFENSKEAYKQRQKVLSFLASKGHDIGTSLDTVRAILHPCE